jgi:DNA-binding CsgD family transcriptional regulator
MTGEKKAARIARPRLIDALARDPHARVRVLVAPPGFGKTVLLEQFAARHRVAYVNVGLVGSRAAFIRELAGVIAPHSLAALDNLPTTEADAAAEEITLAWLRERLRGLTTTVVIDDLQSVAGEAASMRFLERLIEESAPGVRWLLASRTLPELPLSRWRANAIAAPPVTEHDLRFTLEDARDCAETLMADVGPADLATLVELNAGWPIGIQLALASWNRFGDARALFTETRRYLFDYLQSELWRALPPDERDLIVACALVPRLSADVLLEAGFPGAGAQLLPNNRRIPLVTQLPDGRYELHDLFRDFVIAELASQPALRERMFDTLGRALERTAHHAELLGLARSSGEPRRIVAALASAGLPLAETGGRTALEETLLALPPAFRGNGIVRAIRAAIAHSNGRREAAEREFRASLQTDDLPPRMRVAVVVRLSKMLSRGNDGPGAIDLLLPLLEDPALDVDERVRVFCILGTTFALAGRHDDADRVAQELHGRVGSGAPELQAEMRQNLALMAFHAGRWDEARFHAHEAVTLGRERGLDRVCITAYSVLTAVIETVELRDGPIRSYGREVAAAGERLADRGVQRLGIGIEFVSAARSGDAREVRRLRAAYDRLIDATIYPEFGFTALAAIFDASEGDFDRARHDLLAAPGAAALTLAETLIRDVVLELIELASGEPDGVRRPFSEERCRAAASTTIDRRHVETARLYHSLALWVRGRPAQARKMIPDGDLTGLRGRAVIDVVRALIELPYPVPDEAHVRMLCDRLADADCGAIGRLLFRVATREKANVTLSRAEVDLLRAFSTGGGRTADVARTLKKSPHTVRNQMRSVLAKLDCASRNQAIIYARERGWL